MAVTLTIFNELFLNESWKWLQDVELRNLIGMSEITKIQQIQWFENLDHRTDYFIWGVLYNNIPIGATGIKNIKNNHGEYWGYIGVKKYWGVGLGNDIIQLTELAAKTMKINTLELKVFHSNIRAVRMYKKNGYSVFRNTNSCLIMRKKLK